MPTLLMNAENEKLNYQQVFLATLSHLIVSRCKRSLYIVPYHVSKQWNHHWISDVYFPTADPLSLSGILIEQNSKIALLLFFLALTHDLVGDGGRHHKQPHQPVRHGQGHHKAIGHCAQSTRGQHGRNHKGVAHLRTNTSHVLQFRLSHICWLHRKRSDKNFVSVGLGRRFYFGPLGRI